MYMPRRVDLADEDAVDSIRDLHKLTFPESPMPDLTYGAWWLIYPDATDDPVAFCGAVHSSLGTGFSYLKRAGVLRAHWGHGLQRRMIRLRERWQRAEGFHTSVTDTTWDNIASANNLIACGYRLFEPVPRWAFKNGLYFKKTL